MTADISTISSLFPWHDLAEICKSDSRIRFFVDRDSQQGQNVRQFVDWKEVLAESDQNRAFSDATALASYARFAALAHSSTQAAAKIDDLTAGPNRAALKKFLTAIPVMSVAVAALILLLVLPERTALAVLIASIAIAPITGLAWRAGRTRHSITYLALAVVSGVFGVTAVSAPLVFRFRYSYLCWIFLIVFFGIVVLFGLDHVRRPIIRDLKTLLLEPHDYGLARRARKARMEWLEEALDEAVMPELIQTINRLLGPGREKRLLVQEMGELRVTYSEVSRISTQGLRRAEDALRRQDGGSIALSGPRGCGKSDLLKQLSDPESRFSVRVSAPTKYTPQEFLIELFQRLCVEYIKDRGFSVESDNGPFRGGRLIRILHSRPMQFARVAVALAFVGLLVWDIIGRAAARQIDRMPKWVWAEKPLITGVILAALALLVMPKRNWQTWFRRVSEPSLVARARRHLIRLQAEQTATLQMSGTLPVMQAAVTRAVAQRSLPWTMPQLVAHLEEFVTAIAETENRERGRKVLICVDEVDRIGSADEAAKFLSEIKAIFGVPNCYFFVAIAEELGLSLSSAGVGTRSVVDNAFDEIISLEPMSFESCRDLLTRRVPGFTVSFVWLSFVLSAGLPRDLIRVARRLTEMAHIAIESDYELRLAESAERLIREEAYDAATATRGQIARLTPGPEWGQVLDQLRLRLEDLQPASKPTDTTAALRDLAQLPKLLPVPDNSGVPALRDAVVKLAAFALLCLTTCDLFKDDCYDIAELRDPASESPGPYVELAVARRELAISTDTCRSAIEKIRITLGLD